MTRSGFFDSLLQGRPWRDRRPVDDDLRDIAMHVRCLLWHGEVIGLPGWESNAMDYDRGLLQWKIEIQDESAAQQILPLEVLPDETYATAWFRSRMHDDDVEMWHHAATALLEGRPSFSQEFRCRDRFGNVHWQREDLTLQVVEPGRWRAFSVVTDITDRKHAEEELQKAKESAEAANRAKDRFLAMLSHELRTPLTPVLAMVNLIESRNDLPDDLRADMEMIHRNIEMEARLIDDLLDMTRVSRGKVELRSEIIDAHAVIQSALQTCGNDADAKQLEITLNLDAARHHVWADSARLQQVFWNLLKNAIKFTPAGGKVQVRTSNATSDDPEKPAFKAEVVDTGIGIEAEMLPRLYDEFEQGERNITRQFGGLGLGLSISRSLVQMQAGTLHASSAGRSLGATFTVTLPTKPRAAERLPAEPKSIDKDRPQKPTTILLVEDHLDTLRIMSRLLRSAGYHVLTADSVATALTTAGENKIDMLITDLGLPDGSGVQIIEAIGARPGESKIPGIALSGFGMDEDIRMSKEVGFVRHLIKPVSFRVLAEAIREVLG
jgi:two-component system CheB/CheR fusion protein